MQVAVQHRHRLSGHWGMLSLLLGLSLTAAVAKPKTHVVKEGETLWRIATSYHLTVDELRTANDLAEGDVLQVGAKLQIPGEPEPRPSAGRPALYQVNPGDNLYRIAERFGLTVEALADCNQIETGTILQIGQKLKLPGGVAAPAEAEQTGKAAPSGKPAPAPAVVSDDQPAADETGDESGEVAPDDDSDDTSIPELVYVSAHRAHLRGGASTLESSLGTYAAGTKLKVTGKDGMWWQVKQPATGKTAWVAGWVTSRRPVTAASPRSGGPLCIGYVLSARLNVRPQPTTDEERIAVAARGTKVSVLSVKDEWAKVKFDNGTAGWVNRGGLRMPPVAGDDDPDLGHRAVRLALAVVGSPYVRGGASRGGYDCSGLVYSAYRQLGIRLPRTARDQYGVGTAVSRGNLRPGDLVFFKNTYRRGISHVGIYVGNDRFVHAVRPGRGVAVTQLSDSYYADHYAGAYRVTD